MDITKGIWTVDETQDCVRDTKGYLIADCACLYNLKSDEEEAANAILIAEAGTVANECGVMPKELLQQRDELLEALKPFANFACDDWEVHGCYNCIAKQAIKKATK